MQRNGRLPTQLAALLLFAALAGGAARLANGAPLSAVPESARQAYERSDYQRAVMELQAAAVRDPRNGDVELLLAKCYLELQEYEAAVQSAEKAVQIDPSSSVYHEWLGRAYGEKASRSSVFSGIGLARRTHKEFETAVQLDDRNFAARQALIEFDCSAPGLVGGGEDKARPEIARLQQLDAAEGHYAEANCRRQQNDFSAADLEFQRALDSHPQSVELVYDIGDYALKRSQPDRLFQVADLGQTIAPNDPRGEFYRAVGLILKNERLSEAERLLETYLRMAPKRDAFPRYATAHEWLGRLNENKGDKGAAAKEYQVALQLDPKNKNAREALRRLERG
jgi:tetratricopeptide (TPR) repeat protein